MLIDFKTTFLSEGDKAGATRILTRYGPQINLYREALEAVTGLPVDEAWLYLTGSGVFLPVPR